MIFTMQLHTAVNPPRYISPRAIAIAIETTSFDAFVPRFFPH
jgi:hypothetical protein